MTIADYLDDPRHALADQVLERVGFPSDYMAPLKCVDCGKEFPAIGMTYIFTRDWEPKSGPHCGCKQLRRARWRRDAGRQVRQLARWAWDVLVWVVIWGMAIGMMAGALWVARNMAV